MGKEPRRWERGRAADQSGHPRPWAPDQGGRCGSFQNTSDTASGYKLGSEQTGIPGWPQTSDFHSSDQERISATQDLPA